MIRQGLQVKIVKGENAGRQGVVIAKAPGAGKPVLWMVQVEGKGQIRFEEKDLAPLS